MANYLDYEVEARRQRVGRGWLGWTALIVAIAALTALAVTPSGYLIEQPGEVHDTLGTVSVDGEDVPLVDIPRETTYPTTGSLDLLTVRLIGSREQTRPWIEVAAAWLDSSQEFVPVEDVYPEGVTTEQRAEISAAQMTSSQQTAVAAALTVLGIEFETTVTIVAAVEGGPADGELEAGDVIVSFDGQPVADGTALRAAVAAAEVGTEVPVVVLRDGAEVTASVAPVAGDNGTVIGVELTTTFDFPFEVAVQLESVGGPSAGQIFALAIVDKLTPGALTGGQEFAGTGTIAPDGTIGSIGGIRQKLVGADRAGADYFLAPLANCDEVVGHIPEGMQVFAVSTIADSLSVLNTVSSGASTAFLPRCS